MEELQIALAVLTGLAMVAMAAVAVLTYWSTQKFYRWGRELREPVPILAARLIEFARYYAFTEEKTFYETDLLIARVVGPGFRLKLLMTNPGDVPIEESGYSIRCDDPAVAFNAFGWGGIKTTIPPHGSLELEFFIATKDETMDSFIESHKKSMVPVHIDLVFHYIIGAGSRSHRFENLPAMWDSNHDQRARESDC